MKPLSAQLCALAVGLLPGCSPSPVQEAVPAVVVDAGVVPAAVVVVDAGVVVPAVVDAGVVDVPVVETQVDAGHLGDGAVDAGRAAAVRGEAAPSGASVAIFNRLLVKPGVKALGQDALETLVEKATGQRVQSVRRTAGTFWLVQMAPTSPPRTRADQQRLIRVLNQSGAFTVVEADQLMTIH
jgi:hypothetical protein